MRTQAQPDHDTGANPFIAEIMRGLVGCLAGRADECDARNVAYARALAFCIRAFQPRDILELTAAGHCLTFHQALSDAAYDMLHEPDIIIRKNPGAT